jgi:hypothetical protein
MSPSRFTEQRRASAGRGSTSFPDVLRYASHTSDTAIEAYLTAHNDDRRPFVWTASTDDILAKLARGRVALRNVS